MNSQRKKKSRKNMKSKIHLMKKGAFIMKKKKKRGQNKIFLSFHKYLQKKYKTFSLFPKKTKKKMRQEKKPPINLLFAVAKPKRQLRILISKIQVSFFFLKKDLEYKYYQPLSNFKQKKTAVAKFLRLQKRYFRKSRIFLSQPLVKNFAYSLIAIFFIFASAFYWYVLYDLPTPKALKQQSSPQTTIIRDRKNRVMYKIYKSANRINLSWEEIPDIVKKATIAIEDADFYKHHGISLKGIVRAFLNNLKQDNINLYQGGSTITQQLVKTKITGAKKTYQRKIKEAISAVWAELIYDKKEILTMYLNEVGYGGPAYGIEAASQTFFGKSAKNLTLAEAALLAGLPAAPTTFSPFGANPQLAIDRQHQVLERMLKLGMINKAEYQNALNETLNFIPQRIDIEAPHFVMFVKKELVDRLGEAQATEGGLDVVTTLDLDIQNKAEEIVKRQINEIKNKYNIHNGAALITNPLTGEILAMVGSVDYFDVENKGYVNVTLNKRQPGSSIKPVNYGYAFDHGYTPTTVVSDTPVVYTAGKEVYKPVNYDGKFHGNVTIRSALANSYNIPAVKTLNSYGVNKMLELGRKMGIKSWEGDHPIGLSLTLGGLEVTMLDMARVYGTIANLGVKKELKSVLEIRDSKGNDITQLFYKNNKDSAFVGEAQAAGTEGEGEQVISQLSAYWLTDILSDNIARLPAFGPYAKLTIPNHKVAVKTGTSNNFRDNWTIGFTPDYLTVVWVGNNDGSFMNKNLTSGITGAAPIWNEIMTNLLANTPPKDFAKPEGLVAVKICAVNGLLTCPYCPQEKTEYFTVDKIPTKTCSFRAPSDCQKALEETKDKSEEEKKKLLSGCAPTAVSNR